MLDSGTLLAELIKDCTETTVAIEDILRRLTVLASLMKSGPLEDWVEHELEGYPGDAQLPPYRVVNTNSTGMIQTFQFIKKDQPIGTSVLKPEHRKRVEVAELRQPIAELRSFDEGGMRPWPSQLLAMYHDKVFVGASIMEAHQIIPPAAFIGIVDRVRTKALRFCLRLNELSSDMNVRVTELPTERVTAMVQNNFFGPAVVGSTTGDLQQNHNSQVGDHNRISTNDLDSLAGVLEKLGVAKSDISALKAAVKADDGKSGDNVKKWLSEAALKLGPSVLGPVAKAIADYLTN